MISLHTIILHSKVTNKKVLKQTQNMICIEIDKGHKKNIYVRLSFYIYPNFLNASIIYIKLYNTKIDTRAKHKPYNEWV